MQKVIFVKEPNDDNSLTIGTNFCKCPTQPSFKVALFLVPRLTTHMSGCLHSWLDINCLFNMFTGAIHIGTRLIHLRITCQLGPW